MTTYREKVLDKVISVIEEQLPTQDRPKVEESSNFREDIEDYDSLDVVETLMALEEAYSIEVTDKEAQKLETVKDLVDIICIKTA